MLNKLFAKKQYRMVTRRPRITQPKRQKTLAINGTKQTTVTIN